MANRRGVKTPEQRTTEVDRLFGQRMRTLREEREMSLEDFHHRVQDIVGDRTPSHEKLRYIELGLRPIRETDPTLIFGIAQALGVPLTDLIDEPEAQFSILSDLMDRVTWRKNVGRDQVKRQSRCSPLVPA